MKTKTRRFFILTLLIISSVYLPIGVAQDYTTWNLPEGAKARLGKGRIVDLQFSPDSKLLAVASSIGIWIYDADTSEEVALLTGQASGATSIAFSPDGLLLASGSWDTTIRLWNVSTFTLNRTITGHAGAVNAVAFSPDGLTLVSGSVDKTVGIWSPFSGKEKMRLTGHTDAVTSVAFSADGWTLASGSADKTIRLWDALTGGHQQTLTGHTGRVTSVAFSPDVSLNSDGKTLASGSWDKTIRLWDMETGILKHTLTDRNMAGVNSISFRPDGYMLASVDWSGLIRLWATVNGELKQKLFSGSWGGSSVCFSPDGFTLARGQASAIQLWDVFPKFKHEMTGHNDLINSVSFSSDGSMFVSSGGNISGDDKIIRLWDVETGALKQTFTTEDAALVFGVSFLSDGQTIASVGREMNEDDFVKYRAPTLRLWDVTTGSLKRTFNFNENWIWNHYNPSFSPDGLTLASAGHVSDRNPKDKSQSIRLFDIRTGSLKHVLTGHTDYISSVVFSPDGETLASGSSDETVCLWDVSTGSLKHLITGHTGEVRSVMFSPDSRTLATSSGSTIHLWDAATGKDLHTLIGSEGNVWQIVFSPDGKTISRGGSTKKFGHNMRLIMSKSDLFGFWTSILWDVSSGRLKQSDSPFSTIDGILSPDGLTLVASHQTSRLYVYDLSTATPKQTITGHSGRVYSVSFSPDGETLAVGSEDAIHLWDVEAATLKATYPINATTVAFSSHPWIETLASGGWDSPIRLWDVANNRQEKMFIGHTGSVNSVAFATTSRKLVSGSADKTIRLWDVETGETTQTLTEHTDSVLTLAVNPHFISDVLFASGSADKTILLWDDIPVGGEPFRTLTGHTEAVLSVAYNPQKVYAHPDLVTEHGGFQVMLASGSADKTIHLWEGVGGAQMGTLTGHSGSVTSLAFSPDGKTLMSGSSDTTIRWWELGKVVSEPSLKDPDATVIWENPFIGTHKHTFGGHTAGVTSLAFSPVHGWTLASGSYDGTVLLWDLFAFTPPPKRELAQDINDDGVVNIQDLVLVASNLGETGENDADVNDDGVVNIQDLVLVASNLGEVAGPDAPVLVATPERLTPDTLQQVLDLLRTQNDGSVAFQRAIANVEQLLVSLTPKETLLLANYPNPFNPETWIPYQLASPAEVTLRIHAVDGSLVRTLSLGHKAVGIYQSRSRAAYWDGKNQLGEPVASGVYFYTLTADDFNATRKMLIRK